MLDEAMGHEIWSTCVLDDPRVFVMEEKKKRLTCVLLEELRCHCKILMGEAGYKVQEGAGSKLMLRDGTKGKDG